MAIIENLISDSPGPIIPEKLSPIFEIRATTPLTTSEACLFSLALLGIDKQIETENMDVKRLTKIFALITENGEFSLKAESNLNSEYSYEFAFKIVFAVYCVGRWRNLNLSDKIIISFFAEELVHHYWSLDDEAETKFKVLEVMKQVIPDTKLEEICNVDLLNKYIKEQDNSQ